MKKHTLGPWVMREYSGTRPWDGAMYSGCDIEGADGNRIVANLPDYKHPYTDDSCCEANAHLLAAAPELLEALEMAVRQGDHDMLLTGEELRQCRAAIAKARGEA